MMTVSRLLFNFNKKNDTSNSSIGYFDLLPKEILNYLITVFLSSKDLLTLTLTNHFFNEIINLMLLKTEINVQDKNIIARKKILHESKLGSLPNKIESLLIELENTNQFAVDAIILYKSFTNKDATEPLTDHFRKYLSPTWSQWFSSFWQTTNFTYLSNMKYMLDVIPIFIAILNELKSYKATCRHELVAIISLCELFKMKHTKRIDPLSPTCLKECLAFLKRYTNIVDSKEGIYKIDNLNELLQDLIDWETDKNMENSPTSICIEIFIKKMETCPIDSHIIRDIRNAICQKHVGEFHQDGNGYPLKPMRQ